MKIVPSVQRSVLSLEIIMFLGFLCTCPVQAQESEGTVLIPQSIEVETEEIIKVKDNTKDTKPTDPPVIHDVHVTGEVDSVKKVKRR